ncbi:hypothetical protein Tco_0387108 [Tanacetum coccineum]
MVERQDAGGDRATLVWGDSRSVLLIVTVCGAVRAVRGRGLAGGLHCGVVHTHFPRGAGARWVVLSVMVPRMDRMEVLGGGGGEDWGRGGNCWDGRGVGEGGVRAWGILLARFACVGEE